jgi:alpha-L-rhamnosidase
MHDVHAMVTMAMATGRIADAARYRALGDSIRAAFVRAYVYADGTVGKAFTNRDGVSNDVTQTSLVMGLHLGLIPETHRTAAITRLVHDIAAHHDHLTTGFLGTAWLMPTLSDNGQDSVAYRVLFQETFPSWFYMIRHGATTMWERWNGDSGDKAMNSYNHYAYGVVGEWLYRYVAGIDTDADTSGAGFHAIRIQPRPNARLTHVHGEYDSVYGTIVSDWTLREGTFTLSTTIPPNTHATVILPTGEMHQVGAGTYRYSTVLSPT